MKNRHFNRQCGDCTSCCRTLAVRELNKPAGASCRFAKQGLGCTKAKRPATCRTWNCAWLGGAIDVKPHRQGAVPDRLDDGVLLVRVTHLKVFWASALGELVTDRFVAGQPFRIINLAGGLIWEEGTTPQVVALRRIA